MTTTVLLLPLLSVLAAAPPAAKADAAAATTAGPAGKVDVVDRVAALVDGEVITLSEVEDRAGAELRRAEAIPQGPGRAQALTEALRHALDGIISDKLLQKQAQVLQLQATDQQVDAAVEDIRNRNHFTPEQLDRALAEQGLDKETFRAQVRRELESYQVMQAKVRSKVKLTDDDLRNYYQTHPQEFGGEEEVRVRHIFLPLAENASPAEEARVRGVAAKIEQRLAKGEDFARVAREISKGPSAKEGGDLGWLKRGTIQKQLEDVAFGLKVGQVSSLVRAGAGLHLLKLEERRHSGSKAFDDVKEEIRGRLFDEQVTATRQQLLEEIRKGAVIDIKVPELRG
jgi:peptidyl-prolyl cis-trans isomerase SurA